MPIDLVIDERDGGKSELGVGDSNNNANRSTADSTSHSTEGSSSTPDMVSRHLDPTLRSKAIQSYHGVGVIIYLVTLSFALHRYLLGFNYFQ